MESLPQAMSNFNYDSVAELFSTRSDVEALPAGPLAGRRPKGYGRFARAAYAIRFAIEELPADLLPKTCMRVDELIIDSDGIRRLYESEGYPFIRRTPPVWAQHSSNILPWKGKGR